jgi:hypothetical protein
MTMTQYLILLGLIEQEIVKHAYDNGPPCLFANEFDPVTRWAKDLIGLIEAREALIALKSS